MKDFLLTDEHIAELERRFSADFDSERRTVLRLRVTADVRACAGSGKTTVLVAKLAALTSQWSRQHQGILVLSHTNVARVEIQRKFETFPALQRLNRYPHFLGTVHSFLNQFLSVNAAIAKFGTRPVCMEDERYEFEARRRFVDGCKGAAAPYRTASNWARNQKKHEYNGDATAFASREIVYHGHTLSLATIGVGDSTATYKQFAHFKEALSRLGYFRYVDTDALAAWYLSQHPQIAALLAYRFPVVFIDEAQDTSQTQSELLDHIFLDRSTVQRFGDDRQAIFQNADAVDGTATFPRDGYVSMTNSKRMSKSIATLVQNVCACDVEALDGNGAIPACSHTVFLFDSQTVTKVLRAFCRLVFQHFKGNENPDVVKAVGFSTRLREEENKFPSAIGAYWPHYKSLRTRGPRLTSFEDALTTAHEYLEVEKDVRSAQEVLLDALAIALRLQGCQENGCAYTRSSLLRRLQDHSPGDYRALRLALASLCRQLGANPTSLSPETVVADLSATLTTLGVTKWTGQAREFLSGKATPTSGEAKAFRAPNVYVEEVDGTSIHVGVGTIHSVKGETLRALLLLETFVHVHDLRLVLDAGYFTGKRPSDPPATRLHSRLKTTYVAMSRPTHLLCLAMHQEHVTEQQRSDLTQHGWTIQVLN